MGENKVRFGLKNVHYAILTEGDDTTANSYATPVAVPGAVSLTLDANVSSSSFYADNITYYKNMVNNGYTGSLEMARINDAMMKDVWGLTGTDYLTEKTGVQPKAFALLFQIEGDQNEELYVFYRVIPTNKPTIGSSTKTETVDPAAQTFDFEVLPLVTGPTAQKGLIKSRTTDETPAATRAAWFTTVQIPAA